MTGGYTQVFGGTTVYPTPLNYALYTLVASQSLQLQWATDNFPANANVVARINDLNVTGASSAVLMPVATNATLGEVGLFNNFGTNATTIQDSTGATIVSIPTGAAYYIYLINNSTAAGTWRTFQFGAGTSAANAAALAGAGLSANGAFLQQIMAVTTINSNYTVGVPDRDKMFNWSGGSGTVTLPLAATAGNNFYFQIRNSGSGTLTVATSGGDTLNGGSSVSYNIGDSSFIVCDGTSWWTLGLGAQITSTFTFQQVSLAGLSGTQSLSPTGKTAYRFTGAMAGATNIQVATTVTQYWVDNETTGGTLGFGTATQIAGATQITLTAGTRYILYCDGTNVLNADTAGGGLSNPVTIAQGGTGATTAAGAVTNLGGTSIGAALFTTASTTAAQTTLNVLSSEDATAMAMGF